MIGSVKALYFAILAGVFCSAVPSKSATAEELKWFPENPIETSISANQDFEPISLYGLIGLEKIQSNISLGSDIPLFQMPGDISHTLVFGGLVNILPSEGISDQNIHSNLRIQYLLGTKKWTGKWVDEVLMSFGYMAETSSRLEKISEGTDISPVIHNLMANAYFIGKKENYNVQLGLGYTQPLVSDRQKSAHLDLSLIIEGYLSNTKRLSLFLSFYHRQWEPEIPENYLDRFNQFMDEFKTGIKFDIGLLEFMPVYGIKVYKMKDIGIPKIKLRAESYFGVSIDYSPIGLN
tara:strand:+ start:153 stop:1028 length:876 start_codon:yes stop_codon:yes gene_type:complete